MKICFILSVVLAFAIQPECNGDDASLADGLAAAGSKLAAAGKVDQAEQTFYRALAYNFDCGLAYYELARLYDGRGDVSVAANLYANALPLLHEESMRVVCRKRIVEIDPSRGKIALALKTYASDMTKIETNCGSIALARISELRIALSIPKKTTQKAATPDSRPFSPIGRWIKNDEAGCVATFAQDGRLTMQGVPGKWTEKDSAVIIEWSRFWGVSRFLVNSNDTMTDGQGNKLARQKE